MTLYCFGNIEIRLIGHVKAIKDLVFLGIASKCTKSSRKGKNAVQARKKLSDVYGEGVLTVRQCQNWFAKFRSGNFDAEDAPRLGRPVEADKDAIKALVDANRRITQFEKKKFLFYLFCTIHHETKGKNAVQARKKLTDVYGEGVLTVRQCQNWFAKFRSGNFDAEDAPRLGRPVEADKDAIKALFDANRRITTHKIRLRLNLSNLTVYDHLKGLGLSSKLDVCVPHVLTERNLCRRIDVCDSLLKRPENDPFLKRIITGDEKGHEAKKMNRLKPFTKPIFTK
ncbi:histone-lysine N-methyltransferase SETMAR [Trichonephila clavipes]|nr:histone-lysine N-methyltransferase SETMAR [Trichonephila clavipes]